MREDGYWYFTSMAAHAIGLMALAMISLAIPRAMMTAAEKAPSFDEATVDHTPAGTRRTLRRRQDAARSYGVECRNARPDQGPADRRENGEIL